MQTPHPSTDSISQDRYFPTPPRQRSRTLVYGLSAETVHQLYVVKQATGHSIAAQLREAVAQYLAEVES